MKRLCFVARGDLFRENGGIYSSDTGISESGTAGVVYAARDRFNRTDRKTVATGFGDRIGIYHSGMSDNMRAELWRSNVATNLSIDTRSPFVDLSAFFGIWD